MFTAAQIAAMDDREMALHASGSYGPKLRNDFIASVRKIAEKADARESLTLLHGGRRPDLSCRAVASDRGLVVRAAGGM